jgi:branched-subunit amino acid aminotransferase/4-amino-4-deoxychorismate lyase
MRSYINGNFFLEQKAKISVFDHGLLDSDGIFYDAYTADECFLTATAAEIVPVVSLDRQNIGSGQPGPLTQELMKRFRKWCYSSALTL